MTPRDAVLSRMGSLSEVSSSPVFHPPPRILGPIDRPVVVTVGVPGFNATIPMVSRDRVFLAGGLSIALLAVGGTVLATVLSSMRKKKD